MFTIKFYSHDGCRQVIEQADSFTILRSPIGSKEDYSAEITMHRKNGDSMRLDIGTDGPLRDGWPPVFAKAIIENAAGKTTEIVTAGNNEPRARAA